MKKIKLLIDNLLSNIEKINPDLYRKISYDGYKKYSEILNNIKYNDKYFFHGVCVEISKYCNRKCHYCPNKDYETPKEFMSWEVFKNIVKELKEKYKLSYLVISLAILRPPSFLFFCTNDTASDVPTYSFLLDTTI